MLGINIYDTLRMAPVIIRQRNNLTHLAQQIADAEVKLKDLQDQQAHVQNALDAAFADRNAQINALNNKAQENLQYSQDRIDQANLIMADAERQRDDIGMRISDFKAKQDQYALDLKALQSGQRQLLQDQQDTINYKHELDQRENDIGQMEAMAQSNMSQAQDKLTSTTKIQQDALMNAQAVEDLKKQLEYLQVQLEQKTQQAQATIDKLLDMSTRSGPRWQKRGGVE